MTLVEKSEVFLVVAYHFTPCTYLSDEMSVDYPDSDCRSSVAESLWREMRAKGAESWWVCVLSRRLRMIKFLGVSGPNKSFCQGW